jgi:hypothetical protein
MPTIYETIQNLPPSLRVSVDYYNAEHKELLSKPPYPETLQRVAENTIHIPSADLLAYYLFWKQRSRPDLYSNLASVRSGHLEEAAGELANLITFDHGSIHAQSAVKEGATSITGRLGEAVGVSVMNQIHNVTSLDWIALPERKGVPKGLKPMDYRNTFGSDGKQAIQLECKGSFLPEGDLKAKLPTVSNHASDIAEKKKRLDAMTEPRPLIWRADVRYGTITTFGKEGSADAHCWLLDPPSSSDAKAADAQAICRLLNVTYWLRLIAPRSYLSTALANRAAAIASAESVDQFQYIPLMRGSGKSFEDQFEEVTSIGSCSSKFFFQRSTVNDYPAGGTVVPMEDGSFLFVGVREDLLALAVRQDFDGLRKYNNAPGISKVIVHAVFSKGQAKESDIEAESNSYYVHKELSGKLLATSGGLVIAFLSAH